MTISEIVNNHREINEAHYRCFVAIGKMYADKYRKDQEAVKKTVGESEVVRKLLSETYWTLRRKNECEDIRALPESEKLELWKEAKAWCSSTDKEQLLKVVKSIIAIGALI